MIKENLINYFQDSIKENWEKPSLSDYKGVTYTYAEVANHIYNIHKILKNNGIKPGDKIALIGKNSANWGICLIAVLSYGAVVVPILPDFMPQDIQKIISHSDSLMLFSSKSIFNNLDHKEMPKIRQFISVDDYSILYSKKEDKDASLKHQEIVKNTPPISLQDLKFPEVSNESLALISYTSGTTGNSKGVMLKLNSLSANVRYAQRNMPLESGDKIVSFLPLAHAYGLAFEFLFPFTLGCHITFLTKTPSPQIIAQAFDEIKPRLILSVPLVIEKIYKKKILPIITKPTIRVLLSIPLINNIIYGSIRKKLYTFFGGNFHEIVIGGAPFNADAEKFFKRIKFPYTIGYGMTECGPLISYASWDTTKLGASGRLVDTLELKIDSEDPYNSDGEICVKGENVMDGYYKNPDATKQAIDSEGWLHTGDLGVIDKDGNIYIKGRSKSMILGPSGQNIFPEEIESKLNNMPGIIESLVIDRDGRLIALIAPDREVAEFARMDDNQLDKLFAGHIKNLNKDLPGYMQVAKFELQKEDFIKTPKRNIKRFLYT